MYDKYMCTFTVAIPQVICLIIGSFYSHFIYVYTRICIYIVILFCICICVTCFAIIDTDN